MTWFLMKIVARKSNLQNIKTAVFFYLQEQLTDNNLLEIESYEWRRVMTDSSALYEWLVDSVNT